MRNVYPTDQCIHLWAHQAQEGARNSSNIHFEGVGLYSYQTTIAAIIDGIVYLSEDSMSQMTSKRIRAAGQATRHLEQFSTTAFSRGGNPRLTHEAMILPAARSAEKTLEYALIDPKTRKATKEKAIYAYIHERERIVKHAARFNVSVIMPLMVLEDGAIEHYQERKRQAEVLKEELRIKAQKKQQREDKKQFQVWLTTGAGRCPSSFHERNNDFITITSAPADDQPARMIQKIRTSQGAECPLDQVVKALKFWSSRKFEGTTCRACWTAAKLCECEHPGPFTPWATNGHTFYVGSFKLTSISQEGTVVIGCHTFSAKTIQEFILQHKEVLGL